MNISIVDDLQDDRDRLYTEIHRFSEEFTAIKIVVSNYASGEEFLQKEKISELSLVFLDIYMPGLNGIELAKKIRAANDGCMIVLVSTSKDFIHESYDLGALYYLVKPYTTEDIQKVLQLVYARQIMLPQTVEFFAGKDRIVFRTDDIFYVDLLRHYVQFHLKSEVVSTYALKFAHVQKVLTNYPCFLVCYRCIIVNMKHVSKIDGRDFLLHTGERLPIRREQFTEIKKIYTNYVFDAVHR